MININLFGGPGLGKSTSSAGLFAKMKRNHMNVEYVTEVAKDLVYSHDFFTLKDQMMVFARQHHNLFKMEGQVDYLVHDSPILLSLIYLQETVHLPKKEMTDLILKVFNSYNNINIFLERDLTLKFQENGRNHNLEESLEIDKQIEQMLIDNNIKYYKIKVGKNTIKKIFKIVKELK